MCYQTIAELEAALLAWHTDDTHSKHRSSAKKTEKDKHKDKNKDYHKDNLKDGGAIFGLFRRCVSGSHFTPLILYLLSFTSSS